MNIYIGENIKRLRREKNITQEELSAAFNITAAAVSKWERCESLPDITLLPQLAHYFGCSIDELMGYSEALAEQEIEDFRAKHYELFHAGKEAEYCKLSAEAYAKWPNDFRVMNQYMWDLAGNYADNDPKVILAHKDILQKICSSILERCTDIYLRLDAINMQGKILHAEGKTDIALALYKKELPDWYRGCGQKTEQLFAKDTPEFACQLRKNMFELMSFAINKKCKELWFCKGYKKKQIAEAATALCRAADEFRGIADIGEIDLYIYKFAHDIEYKLTRHGGEDCDIQALHAIAEDAKKRISELGKTDPVIAEQLAHI